MRDNPDCITPAISIFTADLIKLAPSFRTGSVLWIPVATFCRNNPAVLGVSGCIAVTDFAASTVLANTVGSECEGVASEFALLPMYYRWMIASNAHLSPGLPETAIMETLSPKGLATF